ncbi:hypothetical protein CTKA_00531 [Chthonomonas calidirosea]|uniref:ASPIC and UnbV./Family description n=2 Tax=Chthonomonas TaxID=1077265 RepID=S0ETI7_CHTCT|nr:CRTAC1 family protein [Chthonomonas calidirosea]CCW34450.1 ASPIC and UnbV./Family description [Chthonomonas calidirosea T49]CEK14743.1 hypothetical protein CTKA_00531 [Chthonomonas calidirosea]
MSTKMTRRYMLRSLGLAIGATCAGFIRWRLTLHPSHYPGPFRDVTKEARLHFRYDNDASPQHRFVETTGGGCAFLDFDRDGLLDIFAVQGGPAPGSVPRPRPPSALYRNRGDGTFEDVTADVGLAVDMGYGQGVAVGDYLNTGWPALLVTTYGGVRLFRNDKGHFHEVTREAGLVQRGEPHWATSACWFDYDKDGWLDLFVCHYVSWFPDVDRPCADERGELVYCLPTEYLGDTCVLYHNNRDGTFTDVTKEAGLAQLVGKALGVVDLDYDNDGWPDLYVTNDMLPNWLLQNQHNGHFKEVAVQAGVAVGPEGEALSGMGVVAADLTNHGLPDLFVGNFSHQPRSYFRNNGDGTFSFMPDPVSVGNASQPYLTFGLECLDYDLDGYLDLVLGNGHINDVLGDRGRVTYRERQILLHNRGDGHFVEDRDRGGDLQIPRVTRGLAVGDYNNDGRPDILVSGPKMPLTLFRNVGGSSHHWIGFQLEGTHTNRDAIGTRVTIRVGDRVQTRWVRGASSYCSQSDRRVLFGLGTATVVEDVEIHWLSGLRERLGPLAADRYYSIKEGRMSLSNRLSLKDSTSG